jgi:hypothetical protein
MTSIYQPPLADLSDATVPFDGTGSLENGIAGNYNFSIREIIKEAWAKTKGTKGTIWLALLLYMVVFGALSLIVDFILRKFGLSQAPGVSAGTKATYMVVSQLIFIWVSLPLTAGLWMLGLKLVVRAPVTSTDIFNYFPKVLPLVATTLLMYLMVIIGICLLVLPGIYLAVAYVMAVPLVVEKNLSPWEALEASRKAITHRWFRVFGMYFAFMIILVLSILTIGIGFIWVVPMMTLAMGIMYRNIFGYEGTVDAGQ